MPVTHAFVSAIAEGSDATLVRPSNWNADHTVADGSFVAAKLTATATDIVFGRSTAGAGNGEEIACSAAARSVLDDATVAAMVDTLGGATSTGSGGLARATSPVLVTPALGTPASGVLTNCTGMIYTLQLLANAANPSDAQTVYWGSIGVAPSATADIYALAVPLAGTIIAAYVEIGVAGTLGTTETATISVRLNNTTDVQITTAGTFNAARQQFGATGLTQAVAAGDRLQGKCINPTWSTNPTGVGMAITVLIRT